MLEAPEIEEKVNNKNPIEDKKDYTQNSAKIETVKKNEQISKLNELKTLLENTNIEDKEYGMMLFLMCNKVDDFLGDAILDNNIANAFGNTEKECISELKKNNFDEIYNITEDFFFSSYNERNMLTSFIASKGKDYADNFINSYHEKKDNKQRKDLINKELDDFSNKWGSIKDSLYKKGVVSLEKGESNVVDIKSEKNVSDIYDFYKGFDFNNVLEFNGNGIKIKNDVIKSDNIGNYIELNGVKFYDLYNKSFDGKKVNNLYNYSMYGNVFVINKIENGKQNGKGLQINKKRDITSIKYE